MSDTPVEYHLPPLLMGEHTEEVLRELGYWDDDSRPLLICGILEEIKPTTFGSFTYLILKSGIIKI
jgi:hypothetical protein